MDLLPGLSILGYLHQNPAAGCGTVSNFQKFTAKTPRAPRKSGFLI